MKYNIPKKDLVLKSRISSPSTKFQWGGSLTKRITKISSQDKQLMPLFWKNGETQKFIPTKYKPQIILNKMKQPFIDSLDEVISSQNTSNQGYNTTGGVSKQNAIQLPEVIKTPNTRDINVKQYIQKLVPNKNTRDDLYKSASYFNSKFSAEAESYGDKISKYVPDNDSALRLARLYNAAGSPNINRLSIQDNDWAKQERAYMEQGYIGKDNLYVNTPEDLISELSHSYGFKQGATPAIKNLVDDIMYGNPDNYYEKGKTGYDNPRHNEYQTHSVIEPNLYNFLRGGIKSMSIKDLDNKINQIKGQRIERFGSSVGKYLLDSIMSSKEK